MAKMVLKHLRYGLFCCLFFGMGIGKLWAQTVDLRLTNNNTEIRSIQFRGNLRFTDKELSLIIAEKAPNWRDDLPRWIKRVAFLENRNFKFNPFELQRDVLRIRNHYRRNGFLNPKIDYIATLTQDERLNVIDLIFTIQEGAPIQIEEAQVLSKDGRKIEQVLAPELQTEWFRFFRQFNFSEKRGYSELYLAQTGSQINSWLKNKGYAFAKTQVKAEIDSLYNRANLFIVSDIGKRITIGGVIIAGLENTRPEVVKNLLSFKEGEVFSVDKLIESRKRIFEASQFRAVFYEVLPENETDEARAIIKFTVYEAKQRAFRLRSGVNFETSQSQTPQLNLSGQGSWEHRNMFGRGHVFSTILSGNGRFTQLSTPTKSLRTVDSEARLLVPYTYPNFFHPKLSLSFIPQIAVKGISPLSENHQDENLGQITLLSTAVKSAFVYQFDRYRSASLSRTFEFRFETASVLNNPFDDKVSINYPNHATALSATLGDVNNFLNRQDGFLITPVIEVQDRYFEQNVNTDIYGAKPLPTIKAELNLTAYWRPFKKWTTAIAGLGLATRLFGGQIWAKGSEDFAPNDDRIRRIAYFAGGSNDVRGWGTNMMGTKDLDYVYLSDTVSLAQFSPRGGLAKALFNIEARYTLPRFSKVQLTLFRDKGVLSAKRLSWDALKNGFYAYGAGVRFSSAFGVGRIEFARKMNPLTTDLQKPDGSNCGFLGVIQGCGRWRMDVSFSQAF